MICSACQQHIDVPGYGVARPLDADGGPHVCPTFDEVCNESWFIAQGFAEPPQLDSEAVSAENYTQGVGGKWSRASENRGKGGIAL